jgi:hypothetical protein
MFIFLKLFGKRHKFETCFGFSLENYFSKTPLPIFYLIFSNLIIIFNYELVRFSYEFSKFKNMILKRAIVIRKQQFVAILTLFIPIKILSCILWHAIN